MTGWMSRFAAITMAIAVSALCPPLAQAQNEGLGQVLNASEAKRQLRERQKGLFEQLLTQPDNVDLMFEYARVSIDLEDYEAAISTLERLLIYRQDIPLVRLELAVAYFNLGSYEVAKLYFEQALAEPDLPDNAAARIKPYMEAIAFHTRTSAFSVIANVGITYATNATLGPDSDVIRFDNAQQLIGTNLVALTQGQEEADFGVRSLVNVTHVYDLQRANDDAWKTDVAAFSLRYFNEDQGDVSFARLRTGPRLSLSNSQFGPKVRPYVEGQYLNVRDRGLFASYGLGAEYTNTLSPVASVFGDVGLRYRNYFRQEFSDEDSYNFYFTAGVGYIPFRDFIVRGTGLLEIEAAEEDFNSNYEVGLRGSAEYQYDSGIDWIDRKWALAGFAEVRHRWFADDEPAIAAGVRRRDLDVRGGLSHVFALREGLGIQAEVDALFRESNIFNFDVDNVSATLSLQYRM